MELLLRPGRPPTRIGIRSLLAVGRAEDDGACFSFELRHRGQRGRSPFVVAPRECRSVDLRLGEPGIGTDDFPLPLVPTAWPDRGFSTTGAPTLRSCSPACWAGCADRPRLHGCHPVPTRTGPARHQRRLTADKCSAPPRHSARFGSEIWSCSWVAPDQAIDSFGHSVAAPPPSGPRVDGWALRSSRSERSVMCLGAGSGTWRLRRHVIYRVGVRRNRADKVHCPLPPSGGQPRSTQCLVDLAACESSAMIRWRRQDW